VRGEALRGRRPLLASPARRLHRAPERPVRLHGDALPRTTPIPRRRKPMRRRHPPAPSGGRLFRRLSRHTGAALPTWWIAYYVDGKERRESAHSADLEVAQRLLRTRLHAVDEGIFVGPERERLTINAILDALLDFYAVHGHRSVATAGPQVKAWRSPLGA